LTTPPACGFVSVQVTVLTPIPTVPDGAGEVEVVVRGVDVVVDVVVVCEGPEPPPTRLTNPTITATTRAAVSSAANCRRR
jgi:hypothetical protein